MDYRKREVAGVIPYDETKWVRNRWLLNLFNKYEDYYRNEIERIIRNQRMYWGVNFGQWPAYVVEKLKAQGRRPHQYNIMAKKIESQISSYIANSFDIKYATVSGKHSPWALNLQDMAYSDKSNCDWESSEIIALRDMQVCVGYERMFISDRYDSTFGNIAFEALPPTHVYLDPAWKTPNAWDIKNYFEWGMYSVGDIIDLFPKAKEELLDWKMREEFSGINFGEYHGGVQKYRNTEEKWGDFHRVITFHSVEKKEREWEYDLVNKCLFPETGFEPDTKEDKEVKQKYMEDNGIQEGQYTKVKQKRLVKRIEVICPSLHNEMFLAAGKDRVQTNNCNIYPIGNNFYGQFRGVADDLHDVQIDFNHSQMNIMDIQKRSAKGAFILDEALTGGDLQKKREIESSWNDPAARIWVAEGTTAELGAHGGMIELKSVQPTPDLFNHANRSLDLADWLSTIPAAMDSRSESSTESGKLYQSKVQVGLQGQKYGMKIFERHKKEKAAAYMLQAKVTYSGYPRSFSKTGKKDDVLEINSPAVDPMGRRVVINDITKMPEMKVLLIPATSGINMRTELRAQYTEVLQVLTDPKDRLVKLIFVKKIFGTQDMPEDDKEEVTKALDMLITEEAMGATLRLEQGKMQMSQVGLQTGMPTGEQGVNAEEGEFSEEEAMQGTPQDIQLQNQQGVER
jgi:hypothetical protein